VIDSSLRLLHPFMPYITEEIWAYLPGERKSLIIAAWPECDPRFEDVDAENGMTLLRDLVVQIRNVRNDYKVEPGRRIRAIADAGSHADLVASHTYIFSRLCNVENVELLNGNAPDQAAVVVSDDVKLYLPLAGMIDSEAECKRLTGELEHVKAAIGKGEAILNNEGFISRAKSEVVEKAKAKLAEDIRTRDAIESQLAALNC
jgi:valyl-tRNA synthetase